MSGLAGILAAHHGPGVYRWHAAFDVADVRHAVEHAGWQFGYVDGWVHQDKAGFLADVGKALSFPDWYGQDLDALPDCLREVSTPTVLLWDGWATLAREDRKSFDTLTELLAQRADGDGAAFVTLLRGDGPDVEVPSLDS